MGPTQLSRVRSAGYVLVPDVSGIGAYYGDVLGFVCEYAAGDPLEFAIYARGAAAIMFRRAPDPGLIGPNEPQGGTWDTPGWVSDAQALHDEFARNGVVITYPPIVRPHDIKEFAVRDPNGCVLGFGQACDVGTTPAG